MPGTQRRVDPGIADRLLKEPYRFEFFQAVRVIEHLLTDNGVRTQDVVTRRLHFRNTLYMGFPASEIETLQAFTAEGEATDNPAAADSLDLVPAFMGLLGVQGVLPAAYTEQLASRELFERDRTARAFFDIFTNRALALFYQAWKKYRLNVLHELDAEAPTLPMLLSLGGLGSSKARASLAAGRGSLREQTLAYFVGSLAKRPVSAVTLENLLCDYFSVTVRVEQFVGAWYDVPAEQQTRLGSRTAKLGQSALSGSRVWQRNLRMRLWIGPLQRAQFNDFLPGGEAAAALTKWLKLLTGDALEYDVRLLLDQQEVKACKMQAQGGAKLGYDTFLCTRPASGNRADTRYMINAINN